MTDAGRTLRWGIIGTGAIARVFARAITDTRSGTIGPVCSRQRPSGESFCDEFGGAPNTDIDAALQDCDALYIATPHSAHRDAAIAALCGGIAVLCEKPMTCGESDTRAVVDASSRNGTPLMEGWMYRCHPQIAETQDLLRQGTIGTVQHIDACFGFHADVGEHHRLRNSDLGGGAILDIGGYPMSIAMMLAGGRRPFARWHTMRVTGTLDTTGVDADTTAEVVFESDVRATLRASIDEPLGMHVRVEGSSGSIELPCPFLPESRREGRRGTIVLTSAGTSDTRHVDAALDCFSLEARIMTAMIHAGHPEPPPPMVSHDESIAIAAALDHWRDVCLGIAT